jgi:hypothetical protein
MEKMGEETRRLIFFAGGSFAGVLATFSLFLRPPARESVNFASDTFYTKRSGFPANRASEQEPFFIVEGFLLS